MKLFQPFQFQFEFLGIEDCFGAVNSIPEIKNKLKFEIELELVSFHSILIRHAISLIVVGIAVYFAFSLHSGKQINQQSTIKMKCCRMEWLIKLQIL